MDYDEETKSSGVCMACLQNLEEFGVISSKSVKYAKFQKRKMTIALKYLLQTKLNFTLQACIFLTNDLANYLVWMLAFELVSRQFKWMSCMTNYNGSIWIHGVFKIE